jgi:anti-sigma regulatory factor (Ser/Thr protein kinase)
LLTTTQLPMDVVSVARARQFVASALSHCNEQVVEIARLLTSELATNAVVHAHSPFDVSISECEGLIRIAVSDETDKMPAFLSAGPHENHGRGLQLMHTLAVGWGVVDRSPGKTIWFDLKV